MSAPTAPHDALRAPFPTEAVGKLPKSSCRACSNSPRKRCDDHRWVSNCPECHGGHTSATIHLDYIGHADVTDRLLSVDPAWTWEPMALDPQGLPARDRDGNLWIKLTVLGVTRPGVGDGKNAKECIGDAIRNAAMRFGVALDLWAKGDRTWARTGDQTPEGQQATRPATQQRQPPPPQAAPPTRPMLSSETADLWAETISEAETTDALGKVWQDVVKGGQLDHLIPVPDGEAPVSLRDLMTYRAAEIKAAP